jgi:hypothetical protein
MNGTVIGLELFDSPDTLRFALPKLVRAYALDAIPASNRAGAGPMLHELGSFMAGLAAALPTRHRSVGLGEDLRIDTGDLIAAALLHDNRIVHLSAFRPEALEQVLRL